MKKVYLFLSVIGSVGIAYFGIYGYGTFLPLLGSITVALVFLFLYARARQKAETKHPGKF